MWESFLVIIVVVEAVWILSSIFRGADEERKGPRAPQNPRVPNQPSVRQRASPTSVDRFLEEINRRRRETAERQAAVSPQPPRAPERARPAPRSETLPAPSRQTRIVLGSPPVADVIREKTRQPIAEDTPKVSVSPVPVPPVSRAVPAPGSASPVTLAVPKIPAHRKAPDYSILLPLLRDSESLRTAFVLQEILRPPLARRKRR
jgi:hypothetical protein